MTRTTGKRGLIAFALVCALVEQRPAIADVNTDRASAILVFPRIITRDGPGAVDTVVQLSNTSSQQQALYCFYVNATGHCSGSGAACDAVDRPCPVDQGICEPSWIETDFFIYITPRQPLAWRASDGLLNGDVPLDGDFFVGPTGDSNKGTRVPPVGDADFSGDLTCIVVDQEGRPVPNNVIKGEATVVRTFEGIDPDVSKYNAVGFEAFEADADENRVLVLGGGSNEYAGCPNTLVVDHFFDFAVNPVVDQQIQSVLTLVPCTEDFLNQIPGKTTAQFLVYNEFEQRFSTSTPIDCYFERPLSRIDTSNRERSIFSVFVSGTIVGQTRIRGVQQGLVGVLTTFSGDRSSAALDLHTQGDRSDPDFITLP